MTSKSGKLLRVSQLNSIILDAEIINVLHKSISDIFDWFQPGIYVSYNSEIKLILTLLNLSHLCGKGKNATLGQKMLQIEYEKLSGKKKILLLIYKIVPYIKEKIANSFPGHKVDVALSKLSSFLSLAELFNLLIFLNKGSRPKLEDVFFGLNQKGSENNHNLHLKPSHELFIRELLWNTLNEFLITVIPVLNLTAVKQRINMLFKSNETEMHVKMTSNVALTLTTKCSFCGQYPTLPHHMNCEHLFCYYCLKGNQAANANFSCPQCGNIGKECKLVECQAIS